MAKQFRTEAVRLMPPLAPHSRRQEMGELVVIHLARHTSSVCGRLDRPQRCAHAQCSSEKPRNSRRRQGNPNGDCYVQDTLLRFTSVLTPSATGPGLHKYEKVPRKSVSVRPSAAQQSAAFKHKTVDMSSSKKVRETKDGAQLYRRRSVDTQKVRRPRCVAPTTEKP